MRFQKICVLGLGYIGLPTASTFATYGVDVVGVDVNPQVVETLRSGGLYIREPGLRTLVQAALGSRRLSVSETPEPADAFIITVPAPVNQAKQVDLSYVIAAAQSLLPYLKPGNLVVLESNAPPRTTLDIVTPILQQSGMKAGSDFFLVYSTARVMPGQILRELIESPRVIGGVGLSSAEAGRDLYATFVRGEIIMTNATTAEMVKLMENAYRDVNIALANEFSRLADRFGVDAWNAIAIANRHPRVDILQPGPGVGGHTINVDSWFLVQSAPDLTPLMRMARQVNDSQPQFVVDLIYHVLKNPQSLAGKRISLLGLAYKPDVDDLRGSPAVEIAQRLVRANAQVTAFEPFKLDAEIPGVRVAPRLEMALENAELVVLLVGHSLLRSLEPARLAASTPARLVVDTVNAWHEETWKAFGFQIFRLGATTAKHLA